MCNLSNDARSVTHLNTMLYTRKNQRERHQQALAQQNKNRNKTESAAATTLKFKASRRTCKVAWKSEFKEAKHASNRKFDPMMPTTKKWGFT